ncbi:MAG: class I SAM-dependent methyltransferase [Rubrivivax sp.]|nr:class I SAM-dependent methyltransferase [Rubrivivax sp.]
MNFKLHVTKLAILGRLPFGNSIRRLKRQIFGYQPDPGNIRNTLTDLNEMECAVTSLGRSFAGATILEIGSGWFPTIPIMLSLRGAQKLLLTDLTPHLDDVTFAATLDVLRTQLQAYPDAATKTTIRDFNLEYLAPFDPQSIPDGSVDFIISRTVLEHIPPGGISRLLTQLHPKLSTTGMMIHCIDHSDHLEHRDKSISKINFLTWSTENHKIVNWLTKEGENRLRHHEYRDLFLKSGYTILFESSQPHPETLELAKNLPMKERFAKMTPEQVSILSSIYVLAPQSRSQ